MQLQCNTSVASGLLCFFKALAINRLSLPLGYRVLAQQCSLNVFIFQSMIFKCSISLLQGFKESRGVHYKQQISISNGAQFKSESDLSAYQFLLVFFNRDQKFRFRAKIHRTASSALFSKSWFFFNLKFMNVPSCLRSIILQSSESLPAALDCFIKMKAFNF